MHVDGWVDSCVCMWMGGWIVVCACVCVCVYVCVSCAIWGGWVVVCVWGCVRGCVHVCSVVYWMVCTYMYRIYSNKRRPTKPHQVK